MNKLALQFAALGADSLCRPASASTKQNLANNRRRTLAALLATIMVAVGLVSLTPAAQAQAYRWKNFAGSLAGPGDTDGTGSAARFNSPTGVAVDGSGNVYVADANNEAIRKITPAGVVITLAGGSGRYGFADGTGSAALFNDPNGVAVDGSGNLYVADYNNQVIRKITPAGAVTTLAGGPGNRGSADGTGSAAQFNGPQAVAVDQNGNVYVADSGNDTIRKVTPAGVVTTLAGTAGNFGYADGTGSAAQFAFPAGVAVDSKENVYVADLDNSAIRKITPAGVVTTLAGSSTGAIGFVDGTGSAARFFHPQGLTVDGNGNVYVGDTGNNAIRKVTPAGVVTTLAGSSTGAFGYVDGTGNAARFNGPQAVAVDHNGNVYVGDTVNTAIRTMTPAAVVTTLAGSAIVSGSADGTGAAARFDGPFGVGVNGSGNVYVADTSNDTIRKVTPAGVVTTFAGSAGSAGSADGSGSAARFSGPAGVAVDGGGNVYVADASNDTIRKITPAGVVTTLAGSRGNSGSTDGTGSAARFSGPAGVAVDGGGNVYVADASNDTIRKITPAGVLTTLAGSPGNSGSTDGTGSAARFNFPQGVAVDGNGNTYVADTNNGTIRKVTPAGVVTTLAGTAGYIGFADGTGGAAGFYHPKGVAVDGNGNVYVADMSNYAVRKISPAGVVTTIGGSPYLFGAGDGIGTGAAFSSPVGIAVSSGGLLFVTDNYRNRVVLGTPEFDPDFNGDGYVDYLLFDASYRQTEVWHLQGAAFLNQSFGPTLPSGWALVKAADFDGDGKPDYLLYNASTRQTAIWYMNDTVHLGGVYGPTLPAGWTIAGVADFNGDGSPDYLLFNASTLRTAIWYMNGATPTAEVYGPTLPAGWAVVGVADFNGDGKPDWLLFNASTRQTAIWYMNGATHTGGVYGPTAPAGWAVVGVADFNADGQPDLVLFDASTLQTAIWYMNGATTTAGVYGPTLPTGWQLVAP